MFDPLRLSIVARGIGAARSFSSLFDPFPLTQMAVPGSNKLLWRQCARLLAAALTPLLLAAPSAFTGSTAAGDVLVVPAGHTVLIDGVLAPGEWESAGSLEILVRPDWAVKVRFQHDAGNLYFAFQGLQHGKQMRFPELLVDSTMTRSADWQRGDFWLHSSFNLCEGEGEYNVYRRNGVFQCGKEKEGWSANHFPLGKHSVMEIQISFSKLGIQAAKGTRLGFALDLTDTQGQWSFWPTKAQLAHPASWGTMQLE